MHNELIALDEVHCSLIMNNIVAKIEEGYNYPLTDKFTTKFMEELEKNHPEGFSMTILKSEFDQICMILKINPLDPNEYEVEKKKLNGEINEYLDNKINEIDLEISKINASQSTVSFGDDEISPLFNSDPTIPYQPEQPVVEQQVVQQTVQTPTQVVEQNEVPIIPANNNDNQ